MAGRVNRREALRMIGGTIAGLPFAAGRAFPRGWGARGAPNLIVIMTDDQRQDATSAYGNTILKTPNMDRIAAGGVRFTEAFVTNALCAPSRASISHGRLLACPRRHHEWWRTRVL